MKKYHAFAAFVLVAMAATMSIGANMITTGEGFNPADRPVTADLLKVEDVRGHIAEQMARWNNESGGYSLTEIVGIHQDGSEATAYVFLTNSGRTQLYRVDLLRMNRGEWIGSGFKETLPLFRLTK